jgi:hypothetical protein
MVIKCSRARQDAEGGCCAWHMQGKSIVRKESNAMRYHQFSPCSTTQMVKLEIRAGVVSG